MNCFGKCLQAHTGVHDYRQNPIIGLITYTADITGLSDIVTKYERDLSDCSSLADAHHCDGK